MNAVTQMRRPIELGAPDPFPYMHPLLKKNYGQWAWHDHPRVGVAQHVAKSGDEVWTVRAGTQRQMDVFTIRKLCDIGDEFAEGHVRSTTRSNIEFMLSSEAKVQPLVDKLTAEGFPVGGNCQFGVDDLAHPRLAALRHPGHRRLGRGEEPDGHDASRVQRINEMPSRVRITTSCCQVNCGGQGDISINVQYTKPPKINHDLVSKVCERPAVVARCPVAAIRPAMVEWQAVAGGGRDQMRMLRRLLPALPADADQRPGLTKLAVWVGGKNSNARTKPTFHKMVIAAFPTIRRAGRKSRRS